MDSLRQLLEEYDRLGSAGSAHDFVLRQRRLEDWAVKARDTIATMIRAHDASTGDAVRSASSVSSGG